MDGDSERGDEDEDDCRSLYERMSNVGPILAEDQAEYLSDEEVVAEVNCDLEEEPAGEEEEQEPVKTVQDEIMKIEDQGEQAEEVQELSQNEVVEEIEVRSNSSEKLSCKVSD